MARRHNARRSTQTRRRNSPHTLLNRRTGAEVQPAASELDEERLRRGVEIRDATASLGEHGGSDRLSAALVGSGSQGVGDQAVLRSRSGRQPAARGFCRLRRSLVTRSDSPRCARFADASWCICTYTWMCVLRATTASNKSLRSCFRPNSAVRLLLTAPPARRSHCRRAIVLTAASRRCLCHGCSSCVGHAAVTAGDRRTVRSAQPAAAGRRPAARVAAPPEGKNRDNPRRGPRDPRFRVEQQSPRSSASPRGRRSVRRDGVRRCNAPVEGPGQRSSGPSSSGRWRELQAFISFAGVGSPTLRAAARAANTSDLCSPLAPYDQPPSHAWRPGDRGLAGRDPAADVQSG